MRSDEKRTEKRRNNLHRIDGVREGNRFCEALEPNVRLLLGFAPNITCCVADGVDDACLACPEECEWIGSDLKSVLYCKLVPLGATSRSGRKATTPQSSNSMYKLSYTTNLSWTQPNCSVEVHLPLISPLQRKKCETLFTSSDAKEGN